MTFLSQFVDAIVFVLTIAIIVRAVLSWFPTATRSPVITIVNQITEPILAPLRRIIPTIGAIDITPVVAIILLQIIGSLF